MGKQEVRAATVGFVVSALIVIFALVVGDGAAREDNGVSEWLRASDESMASEQAHGLPEWLSDYSLHVPLIGIPPSPPGYDPNPVEVSESDALMDSLSPGVRASYEGVFLEPEAARKRAREREADAGR